MKTIQSTLILLPGEVGIMEGANKNIASIISGSSVLSVAGKMGNGLKFTDENINTNCIKIKDGMKDLDLSKDFTIDWWEFSTGPSYNSTALFVSRMKLSNSAEGLIIGYSGTKIYMGDYSASWNGFSGLVMKDKIDNVWVHWALTKIGNEWTSYKNGIKFWTSTSTIIPKKNDGDNCIVGDAIFNFGYNAIVDNFRVSNIALWTTNFTPPTKLTDYYISLNADVLFSETSVSGDSGNLSVDFDILDDSFIKRQSNYTIELNGQVMQSGTTSLDNRTIVNIPKLAFTLGSNNIKIISIDMAGPEIFNDFTYIITKEDRDTFIYSRKFQHDKSPQLIGDTYIETGKGIAIKDNIGQGYVALEIPTSGKAGISNIKTLNSDYVRVQDIKKVVDMTFKEDLDGGKIYEIKLNTISDKMKSIKIYTK